MSRPDQILDVLQADIVAALKHAVTIPHAQVFTGDEEDFATRIEKALATKKTDDSGKRGLAIQVLPIMVPDTEGNLPGPPLKLKVQVLIVENMQVNRSVNHGTLMTSSQAGLNVLNFLQLRSFGGSSLYAEKNPITPFKMEPGFGAHIVTLLCASHGGQTTPKALPVMDQWVEDEETGDGSVVLTCADESAEIYYTRDGTYPAPDNGTLYTDPITGLEPGDLIRSAAYVDGKNPSDILDTKII
jgi:hypothetical protein